jgi:hypothetical protein
MRRRLLEAGGFDWSDELFLDLLLNYLKIGSPSAVRPSRRSAAFLAWD